MCKGGTINIDYTKEFPQIKHCQNCPYPITIRATQNKRKHIECDSPYYEMFQ